MTVQTSAADLARALDLAVRTTQAASIQNERAIERLEEARAGALRAIAVSLAPVLPCIVDRGSSVALVHERAGLWIHRNGDYYIDAGDRVQRASDEDLGKLRVDPVDLVHHLVCVLGKHSRGLEDSGVRLESLSEKFVAIRTLLGW